MFGNSDTRETAALALGKLVTRTTLAALKPFVIQITGPLIRVIGDRFNPPVKSAILKTLGLLLTKTPSMLRPFLPQLQRTFVKTLTETDAGVRDTAAKCLSCFIPLQARLDPLVLELVQAVQVTDVDKGVKEAVFEALYGLVKGVVQAKRELSQVSMDGVRDVVLSVYETSQESDGALLSPCVNVYTHIESDTLRLVASKCAGVYLILAPSDKSASFISLITRETQSPSHTTLHFTILTLTALMSDPSTPSPLLLSVYDRALGLSQTGLTHQKSTISSSAVALTNQIVLLEQYKQFHPFHTLQDSLVRVMMDVDRAGEERRDAVCVIKRVAKFAHEVIVVIVTPHIQQNSY